MTCTSAALPAVATTTSRLRMGLIGAGGISQSQHLPNMLRAPHIELACLCDRNDALLGQTRQRFAGDYETTTDHRQLLADETIPAVLIATKPEYHVPLILEALAAGKHVYVEKPLAETPQEARLAMEAQQRTGKLVVVGHNRRMAPACQRVRSLLQKHGGARNIHYRLSDAYWIWGRHMPPDTRVIHEVCHILDLLEYLTQSRVKRVFCISSRPDDEIITLEFAGPCVASITNSGYVHYDMPKEAMEIIVERGAIVVNDFSELRCFGLEGEPVSERFAGHWHPERDRLPQFLLADQGEQAMMSLRRSYYDLHQRVTQGQARGANDAEQRSLEHYLNHEAPLINYMMDKGWLPAIDHFAQCILEATPCQLSTAADGHHIMQVVQAIIQSRASGQPVRVPQD